MFCDLCITGDHITYTTNVIAPKSVQFPGTWCPNWNEGNTTIPWCLRRYFGDHYFKLPITPPKRATKPLKISNGVYYTTSIRIRATPSITVKQLSKPHHAVVVHVHRNPEMNIQLKFCLYEFPWKKSCQKFLSLCSWKFIRKIWLYYFKNIPITHFQ